MIKRCLTSLVATLIVCFLACSSASARVCFLPDSTDCGSSDVNIPDVPCKYYNCKEAGLKNEAYQTCYDERTYNNGGVNVNCKQVKCNISKSDCEAQAKATSQSCKFDDASGCYYLGECKQCNKDLYDLKEPKSGSDWECDSCTGCDGTFYSCTAKEKECKDINSSYTSSCGDSQTAEEVKGVKDSKGNQCYTCKDKPIDKCVDIAANYNLSDSDGITKRYPSINASVTYGKLLGNATYGCGFSVTRTGELNTYTLNTNTVKPGVIDGTDYASVVGFFIKDIEYWVYLGGHLYFEHGGYCYSGLCGEDFFNKDAYLRTKMEIPNELGLYSETAGYCCSSVPGMVKDFKQCVATPKLEKHHPAFYFCKEGALKDNKCYETTYSCSEGYNLVGDKCILPEATCPDGYALDSSKSTSTSYVCSKINYYCENNDKHILSGDKCLCKTNGKIYTIWVEDQETSKQQHEIQWLKLIKRTITTNSQAEVDVVSTAQVNHEMCNIDSATNALNCSHIVSGPIGTLGPDLMNLSKKANGVYTYLNAESEDGSGYYTDVNWKKFSVSINNKIYPVSGIYSQCAETAVIADNGDIYQVKCGKAQTCSEISNGSWKGEKDKNTCPTGYNPEVVESTIGATAFSDGPCYKCEKIEDKTITIYLTNTETKDQSSSTLICNGEIERVNSTTKEYVEFSHDTNHNVKLRLNGPNKPCTELYADPIVLEEDNSYDLYAEFPSGAGSISGYYYDNVPTSFEVIVDGVVVASDEIRRGKIDNTNWTHLRVLSSLNGKVIQPSKSNPYTIKFVYENEKNNTCYKKSSSGTVANKSTIYYYRADEPYKNGECASEMTINVVCDNTNLKAKLYVNGKETQANPNSYQNTEGKWFGDFMNCTGCATVECTFKYGDKTKITIPQTGGPGD